MRIAIDISPIIYSTGVSTYTKNLVKTILEISQDNQFVLFGGSLRGISKLYNLSKNLAGGHKNATVKNYLIPPTIADIVWNKLHILDIEHFTGDVDVFHSSDWTQPPSRAFKVTTIHDLVPILYPKLSHPKIVTVHKRRLELIKKECDVVIVPTNTTRKDVEELGIDAKKIRYIPEAVDPKFIKRSENEVMTVMSKFHIRGKYLLHMGTDIRKNIGRVLAAYMKIKPKTKLKLVIVGHPPRVKDETRGVIYTGRISEKDVIALYSGAEMLLYPSLYEGFGLPILEAFSVGVPVITSNIGSMKEVAGGGACLVDPYSVDDIAEAVKIALKDKIKLVKAGKKELMKYSWKKTAEETLRVYEEAV